MQNRINRLHAMVVGAYLGPFVLTFFITLFILVMQFLWKYIDEMVGKGLEWYIIAELLFYASANLVTLALPLAILLSSIMTFGNLGEYYELVALKSAGISLQKIMYPLIIFTLATSVGAFYFSNNVWPVANLKFASLLYDIRQKKPALDIKEGVYYKGIDGYVIRVGNKEKDNQTIHDVLIYDHTARVGNNKVIYAETGKMQMSHDERYLILTLYNGSSYEEVRSLKEAERPDYPLFRSSFKKEEIRFNLAGFKLERTDEELFKDNYQMLTLKQLQQAVDTLNYRFEERRAHYAQQLEDKLFIYRDSISHNPPPPDSLGKIPFLANFDEKEQTALIDAALSLTRNSKSYIGALKTEFSTRQENVWRHQIEWHRKWTLSIACIVLFFIGAPLGAIIRRGGLGLPVVFAVFGFLIFHVLSIIGEKLAKEGHLLPWQGMWMATVCLLPLGVFLTYKATTDSALMDMDSYTKWLNRIRVFLSKPFKGKGSE